uniref:E3 ubiquitin ligase TRAF3IP2-like isoform X7 n=1 Tax=Myxine glutinosa TaxID=7769 RepID=UPI00358E6EBF
MDYIFPRCTSSTTMESHYTSQIPIENDETEDFRSQSENFDNLYQAVLGKYRQVSPFSLPMSSSKSSRNGHIGSCAQGQAVLFETPAATRRMSANAVFQERRTWRRGSDMKVGWESEDTGYSTAERTSASPGGTSLSTPLPPSIMPGACGGQDWCTALHQNFVLQAPDPHFYRCSCCTCSYIRPFCQEPPVNHAMLQHVSFRQPELDASMRKVFITYSVDSMKDVVQLAKFLRANGFDTMLDAFASELRGLDKIKWMNQYLLDEKCMIIIAVSPAYIQDIEESYVDDLDEHSLHTKYIYRQMQNLFISQGSLNFRFIPVLMPNASKEDLPCWLHSTLVFRWPGEPAQILLRLLREEMVQAPPIGRLPAIISVPL